MPQAPPGYADRVFEFGDLCRIFDVNPTSLTTWFGIIKMLRPFGAKRGHRRVFSQHESYVAALMAALFHAGVPVNSDAISTIVAAAYDGDRPLPPEAGATLTVRQTEAAGIRLHSANIWSDIDRQLKAIEC